MSNTNVWTIALPTSADSHTDEPSHIHIPRPSRVRRLEDAASSPTLIAGLTRVSAEEAQLALEDAA